MIYLSYLSQASCVYRNMENRIHNLEHQLIYETALLDSFEGNFKEQMVEDIENLKVEIFDLKKIIYKRRRTFSLLR
jgi:hypothetical protein